MHINKEWVGAVVGVAVAAAGQVAFAQADTSVVAEPTLRVRTAALPTVVAELVRLVMLRHPELVRVAAQQRTAASQLQQVQAQRGPSVSLDVNAGLEHQRFNVTNISANYQQALANVRLVQPLMDPAAQVQVQQKRQELSAADWKVNNKQQELMLRTIEAYIEVLRATELLNLSQGYLSMHRDYVKQVKGIAQLDVGRASDLPVAQGRVALAESVNTMRLLALEQARAQLQSLTGLSILPEMPPLPLLKPAETLEEAYQACLSASPALQVARAEIDLARRGVDLIKSEQLPRLSLESSGKAGRDWGGVHGVQHDVYLGLRLQWQVWSNGADRHAVQAAAEQETAATFAYEQARDELRLRVNSAWYDFLGQAQTLDSYRDYVRHARDMVDASRQQFAIGRRSLLDVLNAENESFTARSNEAGARYAQIKASVQLLALQGRLPTLLGW